MEQTLKQEEKKMEPEQAKTETKVETPVEVKIEQKTEEKKPEIKKEIKKKEFAIVDAKDVGISTQHAKFIAKFIKKKKIDDAMEDLVKVIDCKKPVPFKGEYPHRGKGIMAGRYPKNASESFIKLLKGLAANASVAGINDPVISEAIANQAARPRRRFGKYKFKRTHVFLKAVEFKTKNSQQKEKK